MTKVKGVERMEREWREKWIDMTKSGEEMTKVEGYDQKWKVFWKRKIFEKKFVKEK